MPYKISGTLSDDSRIIIIKESDWSAENNTISGSGSYEITELEAGAKLVAALKNDGEMLAYGNVTPIGYVDWLPEEYVDQQSSVYGDISMGGHSDCNCQGIGQAIAVTPDDNLRITAISFAMRKYGGPSGSAYMRLYDVTGTVGSTGRPTGSALVSEGFNVSTLGGSYAWKKVTLSSPYSIDAEQTKNLAVTVWFSGGDNNNYCQIMGGPFNSYVHAGNPFNYRNQNGSWTQDMSIIGASWCKDMQFRLYGQYYGV